MPNCEWKNIECVFLDMDGTLLDLNYDNFIWGTLFPERYGEIKGISLAQANDFLGEHMRKVRGTLQFYDLDHWQQLTGVNMHNMHLEALSLLRYRPGALAFLAWLADAGIKAVMATNAHHTSIRVKDQKTHICDAFDAIVSSHDFGYAKETDAFWHSLMAAHPHDPNRCVFIDDNKFVLDAAKRNNIGNLFIVDTPDSERPPRGNLSYPKFDRFDEIYPMETTRRD